MEYLYDMHVFIVHICVFESRLFWLFNLKLSSRFIFTVVKTPEVLSFKGGVDVTTKVTSIVLLFAMFTFSFM